MVTVMTRRRIFLAVLAACLAIVLAAVALVLRGSKSEAATRAAFSKITLGMTEPEVAALLGGPPDSRAVTKGAVKGPESFITNSDPAIQAREGHRDYTFCEWVVPHWHGTSYVAVVFDGDVVACRYMEVAPPGLWDRVRMRLE
jgi:hypothetical protein